MTRAKLTKRTLISSAISLVLCFAMFLGTTFAWFTDSVTSANNIIQSGNLDVEMYLWSDATTATPITNNPNPIFGEGAIAQNNSASTLWEPGKTQVVYLSIKNEGSLALKYQVLVNAQNKTTPAMSEVMEYAIVPNATYDSVNAWNGGHKVMEGANLVSNNSVALATGEEHFFALCVHMNEEAGNEYMNGQINFDITVLASQLASEEDSFGNDYDGVALYPDGTYRVTDMEKAVNATTDEIVVIENESKTFIAKTTAGATGEVKAVVTSANASEAVLAIANANGFGVASYDIEVIGQKDGAEVEIQLFVGPSLMGVTLYHNGTAMDIADYSYNPTTGFVTFTTTEFSPFEVVYSLTKSTNEVKSPDDFWYYESNNHILSQDVEANYIIFFAPDTVNTIDLNGKTLTTTYNYMFGSQNKSDLTVTGNGKVIMNSGFTAFVSSEGKLTINGGEYQLGDTNEKGNFYVQNSGTLVINGGEFISTDANTPILYCINAFIEINGGFFQNTANSKQALLSMGNNLQYVNNQKITLKGGTFVNWNPMDSAFAQAWTNPDVPALIVLADGYTVVAEEQANGDIWYTVVPEAQV